MKFIVLLLSIQQLAFSTNIIEALEALEALEAVNATEDRTNKPYTKKRKTYTTKQLKVLNNKNGKKKHYKQDKVGDDYYPKDLPCRNTKDRMVVSECNRYMKIKKNFCTLKYRKYCAKSCCKHDYKMLTSKNKGCNLIRNRTNCMNAKDGRKDKRFAGQACTWCCGQFCTGQNTNLCEPVLWLMQQKHFVHIGENNIGMHTCPGSELYDGYYSNGYYYYGDGSPYYYGWYDNYGKYHYYSEGDSGFWGSNDIPGDPKSKNDTK